ncbi:MAG: hypothetical protein WD200_01250 [Candidatus Andersenbacteria bacterium]
MPDTTAIDIIARILEILAYIGLYVIIGFGPGFLIGVLTMSRIVGKGNPYIMEVHEQAKRQAAEHNKQWHPNDPRWKKES